MIFFIHIPKCAGNSLQKILDNQSKRKIFKFYGAAQAVNSTEGGNLRVQMRQRLSHQLKTDARDAEIIFGHYNIDTVYNLSEDSKYMTFLRNPVERILSLWDYGQRHKNDDWAINNIIMKHFREFQCIEDYLQSSILNNSLQRIVAPLRPKDFDFIGIQEHFSLSFKLFFEKLNIPIPADIPCENVNPSPDYTPSKALVDLIQKTNQFECDFYQESVELFKERYL